MTLIQQFIIVFLLGVFVGYSLYTKLIFAGIKMLSDALKDDTSDEEIEKIFTDKLREEIEKEVKDRNYKD